MMRNNTDNQALFKRILENQNTAILMFDEQLTLSFMNPAAEMLFAWSARQALSSKAEKVFSHNQEILHALNQALTSNHPFTEREITLQLPAGSTITVDYTVTPVSETNDGLGLLVELTQLDRQLRIAREENLLAQHATTRDVIRGLAHEIKNPLGGLRGAAQLLEQELESAELKEYTDIIIGEADRLQNLLNRMLGPNTLPINKTINIHELLERVRQLVQAESPADITLKRDYDPSVPELFADPDQLIQAILNLARNAAQALGQTGEITLRTRTQRQITIGHTKHKLVAAIQIIDNGPGVESDMIDKIFFPMVTGRAEGTGLGLPIAQNLINQHGGLIECQSRPGETIFTILLPLENTNE